jgi:cell shape-determining protein MreD
MDVLYDIVLWHAIGSTLLRFILYLLIVYMLNVVIQMQNPMYHKTCPTVMWTQMEA